MDRSFDYILDWTSQGDMESISYESVLRKEHRLIYDVADQGRETFKSQGNLNVGG